MQRVVSLALCRQLGGLSPGLCRWRSGLTCSEQPVVHRRWAGVCARPARPFTGEQGRKLCGARFVFAGQKHRLLCSQSGDNNPQKSSGGRPHVAVVGLINPFPWIRCKILIFFINLLFDFDIDSAEFGRGAKQALVHITSLMSSGQYDRLAGIVSTELIEQIEEQCSSLSDARRQLLAVTMDDILGLIPVDLSLTLDKHSEFGRRFCSVTLRFWFLSTPDSPSDPRGLVFRVAPREDGGPQRKIATAVIELCSEVSHGASPDWTVTDIWHWHWHWKQAE